MAATWIRVRWRAASAAAVVTLVVGLVAAVLWRRGQEDAQREAFDLEMRTRMDEDRRELEARIRQDRTRLLDARRRLEKATDVLPGGLDDALFEEVPRVPYPCKRECMPGDGLCTPCPRPAGF